jgi:anti-anti-sigma factor|tara:strand:+ start:167 stop:601 length:435 start_codon:yes stop_codon:yes gene_type:complete
MGKQKWSLQMTEYTPMNGINDKNGTTGRRSLFVDITFSNGIMNACIVGPRIGEREATIVANAINAQLKHYGKKVKSLVLNFSEVQFISSLGLGMCIDVRNTAEASKASTSIVGLTNHLKELFEMMRLDRLFTISGTLNSLDSAA